MQRTAPAAATLSVVVIPVVTKEYVVTVLETVDTNVSDKNKRGSLCDEKTSPSSRSRVEISSGCTSRFSSWGSAVISMLFIQDKRI